MRAHREARDGLWRCATPEQAEELRGLLRAVEQELAAYAAAHAQAEGDYADLADWLAQRAQGAMH